MPKNILSKIDNDNNNKMWVFWDLILLLHINLTV